MSRSAKFPFILLLPTGVFLILMVAVSILLTLVSSALADTGSAFAELGAIGISTSTKELNLSEMRESILKAKGEIRDQSTLYVLDNQLLVLSRYESVKKALEDKSALNPQKRNPKDFQQYEDLLSDLISSDERSHSMHGLVRYFLKDLELALATSAQVDSERRRLNERADAASSDETIQEAEIKSRLAKERLTLQQLEYRTLKLSLELQKQTSLELRAIVFRVGPSIRLPEDTLESTVTALSRYKQSLESAFTKDQERLSAGQGSRDVLEQRLLFASRRIARIGRVITQWGRRAGALNNTISRDTARLWIEDAKRELEALDDATHAVDLLTVEARKKLIAEEAKTDVESQAKEVEELLNAFQEESLGIDAARILTTRLSIDLSTRYGEKRIGDWFSGLKQSLSSVWSYELFSTSDDRPVTTSKIVLSLLLLVVGLVLSRRASSVLARLIFPRFGLNSGASAAFQSLLFYALLLAFSICALNFANVPLTVFTLLGGVLAIGVGFGSQALMNNFISGLIMLVEQPIRPGDLLEVEGHKGIVKRIGARSTIILAKGNIEVVVPNSEILQKSVINWTLAERKIKVSIPVSVAYDTNVPDVDRALHHAAKENSKVLQYPAPNVELTGFGENALDFELEFWVEISSFTELDDIKSTIRREILEQFKQLSISIPFPQRDVRFIRTSSR